jgi:hypothetical protein
MFFTFEHYEIFHNLKQCVCVHRYNFTSKIFYLLFRYNLKVTAHNNAGFSIAEYEFATLTATGGENKRETNKNLFLITC